MPTKSQTTQTNVTLTEIGDDGLMGYISADVASPPNNNYGYGISFYISVWPLLKTALKKFQVGLPSTWIIPNNNNFTEALCPEGTYARDNWPSWAPNWNGVFQTIEGGVGSFWNSQFGSATPKYRMNGTPNCYDTEISSPGWAWGDTTALDPSLMSIAQLSNRILMPPDGITFDTNINGELFGMAWMALPMRPKQTSPAPTGNLSWTLFLTAANFAGPVGFYIPNAWSRLSEAYSTIDGRGLDQLQGYIDTGAMEFNDVPYFEAQDTTGTTYTRIPQLQFPIDNNGNTILMSGINLYSAQAIYAPLNNALKNNKAIPKSFTINQSSAFKPHCTANPLGFTQGNQITLTGFNNTVQSYSENTNSGCTFGLHWNESSSDIGLFPTYFKQQGSERAVIDEADVPASTNLQTQTFTPFVQGSAYQSPNPLDSNAVWNKWVPKLSPATTILSDGSIVTYRWYKFINQPSIVALNLTSAQQNELQNIVVKLHKAWNKNINFMPKASGPLAQLDKAVFVKPPKGYEYGYVPVVIDQSFAPTSTTAAALAECVSTINTEAVTAHQPRPNLYMLQRLQDRMNAQNAIAEVIASEPSAKKYTVKK